MGLQSFVDKIRDLGDIIQLTKSRGIHSPIKTFMVKSKKASQVYTVKRVLESQKEVTRKTGSTNILV